MYVRTLLRSDPQIHIEIDSNNGKVGQDIASANAVQYIRIFEWYLLGRLHEKENDDQIGAAAQ